MVERETRPGDYIKYVYDGSGVKLAKQTQNSSTYYCGNFVYNENGLDYMLFDKGVINFATGGGKMQYFLKDHLGNTRVAFNVEDAGLDVVQVADYYPFGLEHVKHQLDPNPGNKYLYNWKELQDDRIEEPPKQPGQLTRQRGKTSILTQPNPNPSGK